MSKIIHARIVEIIEQVYIEIKNYGHEEQKKKLIAGIVLTGGGAQLQHIKQLVEYFTGMDTRIGYPNEHLAGDSDPETTSPMYATAVGLVMNSLESKEKSSLMTRFPSQEEKEANSESADQLENEEDQTENDVTDETTEENKKPKSRKGYFERWAERFKNFLDNAE